MNGGKFDTHFIDGSGYQMGIFPELSKYSIPLAALCALNTDSFTIYQYIMHRGVGGEGERHRNNEKRVRVRSGWRLREI